MGAMQTYMGKGPRAALTVLAFPLLMSAHAANARSSGHSGHSGGHGSNTSHSSGHHSGGSHSSSGHSGGHHRALGVERDANGKIARSAQAKDAFKRSHPCPSTGKSYGACPGYVIDHVQALKHGGADAPYNMQWQTKEAAKAKDRTE